MNVSAVNHLAFLLAQGTLHNPLEGSSALTWVLIGVGVLVLLAIPELLGMRYIPNNRVGIIEKFWSSRNVDDAVNFAGCKQAPDIACQPRDNPRRHVKARDQCELGQPRLGIFAQFRNLGQQLVGMHHGKGGAGGGIDSTGDRSAGGDDLNDRLPEARFVDFSVLGHVQSAAIRIEI